MDYQWEVNAYNNEPAPDGLLLCEIHAYEAMRYLYALYKLNSVTRSEAAAEKGKIKAKLDADYRVESLNNRIAKYHNRVIQATELEIIRYRKHPTADNGYALCNAIQNLPHDACPKLDTEGALMASGYEV